MGFNTKNASKSGIPDGNYHGTIVSAEEKPTKDGSGAYIQIQWRVDSGATFRAFYTIKGKSERGVGIGQAQLREIQVANGMDPDLDCEAEELLGKKCTLDVYNKTDDYGDKVVIKKHGKMPETAAGEIPF